MTEEEIERLSQLVQTKQGELPIKLWQTIPAEWPDDWNASAGSRAIIRTCLAEIRRLRTNRPESV